MTDVGQVVWLTGPPACGKTTIADRVADRLGASAIVLDSDVLREVLTPTPTYSDEERDRFYAQIAGLAKILWKAGATVLVAATASRRRYRDELRAAVTPFFEVYLEAPLEVLESRDPKGLYAAARAKKIDRLPGRGAAYEPPEAPELHFDTSKTEADTIVDAVVKKLLSNGSAGGEIHPRHVERYLRAHGHPGAVLRALTPLGDEVQEGLKAHGYGRPLRITFDKDGVSQDLTLRTMGPDPFGHDRRADRFDNMVLAYDEFPRYAQHIEPMDVGVIAPTGAFHSIGAGEPFLLTNYVEGELYAHDLTRLAKAERAEPVDVERAEALASYLAVMHAEHMPSERRRRATRDLVGHGEGIFGLVDAFEAEDPIATPERLRRLEHEAVDWLWRLRERDDRSRRTHGDFHPFNILFRDGTDFTVLDASRGGAGDAADDLTALSINYFFFALAQNGAFEGPLREAWDRFWAVYLDRTQDHEVLEMVPPYFAWRALVLVCPAWYPDLAPEVRDRILRFAERLLAGETFGPDRIADLLSGAVET